MGFLYDYTGKIIEKIGAISPESFGAIGDGATDDAQALMKAFEQKGLIRFTPGRIYKTSKMIRVYKDTIIDLNGATILSTFNHLFFNWVTGDKYTGYNGNGNITIKNGAIIGGSISFAHAENVTLDNVVFKNTLNDHYLEICACKNYNIRNCKFIGMQNKSSSVLEYINIDPCTPGGFPWNSGTPEFYDGTMNDGIIIEDCTFSVGESTYAYGFNAFGVHGVGGNSGKHKNISLKNNTVVGFTGCGFRINDMENVSIMNNNIQVEGDGIRIGDVSAASDILVQGNYIVSNSGQKIALTSGQYTGITIAKNATYGTIEDF